MAPALRRLGAAFGMLLAGVLVGSCAGDGSPTQPAPGPMEIVFASEDADAASYDLYLMDRNGEGKRLLRALPGDEAEPRWSPDGRTIAFTRITPGATTGALWRIDVDGTGLRQITPDGVPTYGASWSPDGTQLAFYGVDVNFTPRIGVIDVDGTDLRWLPTFGYMRRASPAWSPDGRRIAYTREPDSELGATVWTMAPDGTSNTFVASAFAMEGPAWSPDGTQLAFAAIDARLDPLRIVVVAADGSNRRWLSDGPGDHTPAWSPDGQFLVYPHARQGAGGLSYHLYRSAVAGGSPIDLTAERITAESPSWRSTPAVP